ncbi:MAG: cytochrome c-type biogenesis CcmF C-terminal domain-containing protein, partial [Saprospiraceae bacterium]
VPWLTLVAGIHTNLVAKATGHSIRSTYVFYLLTFILILYSTFLTRSGVLGESSVHAFTEMGLEWQLVAFIAAFLLLSIALLSIRYKEIPNPTKEEPTASKEFWMFIGSLVLLFSALIITASTSLPVYNKIVRFFNPEFIGRVITDVVPHYNKYQIWIATFIGLLSGIAQYLRFREPNWSNHARKFATHTAITLGISLLLTWLTTQWIQAFAWQYWILLFSGIFTVISNLDYIITFLRGNLKLGGSVLSHIGFGLMIVGIMASGLNKKYVSSNPFVMTGLIEGEDDAAERNILLFKNTPMMMSGYEVTYTKDTLDNLTRTYTVNYKRKNAAGKIIEEFNLYPNILYDKSFEKIAASNPSTKKYWNKDVFTHIKSLATIEMDLTARQKREDSLNYRRIDLVPGQTITFVDTVRLKAPDTITLKKYALTTEGVSRSLQNPDYQAESGDIVVAAKVRLQREDEDSTFVVEPGLVLRGDMAYPFPVQINALNAKIRLHPDALAQVVTPENQLNYKEYNIKQGDIISYNDLKIQFAQFIRDPQHPEYQAENGDIAVGAALNVQDKAGKTYLSDPLYIIRGNRPISIKDYVESLGLHVRFAGINPEQETIQLFIAQAKPNANAAVPVELATNSLRSDYIVLEAIEFPGINFFWIGTTLMMIGLTVSMGYRIATKRRRD